MQALHARAAAGLPFYEEISAPVAPLGRHRVARVPQEPRRHRGHAGAPAARGPDAGRSREVAGRDREHVRVHRRGEGGIGRRHPAGSRAQGGRRDRPRRRRGLHGPEVRPGPRRRDPRGRPLHRPRRAREGARGRARPAVASALHGQAARDAPVRRPRAPRPDAPQGLRVPEGRRGVQQPLHVLHDPADARPHALAHDRVAREGGAVPRGAGRQGARPHLAGHDALRRGPRTRPHRPRGPGRESPERNVVSLGPVSLRVSEDAPPGRLRAHGERAALPSVCRHAPPARLTPHPRLHETRRGRGQLSPTIRRNPKESSRTSRCARRSSSGSRERKRKIS